MIAATLTAALIARGGLRGRPSLNRSIWSTVRERSDTVFGEEMPPSRLVNLVGGDPEQANSPLLTVQVFRDAQDDDDGVVDGGEHGDVEWPAGVASGALHSHAGAVMVILL